MTPCSVWLARGKMTPCSVWVARGKVTQCNVWVASFVILSVVIDIVYSQTSQSTPQPTGEEEGRGCYYKGAYHRGQWDDGCDFICICDDPVQGYYRCRTRCPIYGELPPGCDLRIPSGERCCKRPHCHRPVYERVHRDQSNRPNKSRDIKPTNFSSNPLHKPIAVVLNLTDTTNDTKDTMQPNNSETNSLNISIMTLDKVSQVLEAILSAGNPLIDILRSTNSSFRQKAKSDQSNPELKNQVSEIHRKPLVDGISGDIQSQWKIDRPVGTTRESSNTIHPENMPIYHGKTRHEHRHSKTAHSSSIHNHGHVPTNSDISLHPHGHVHTTHTRIDNVHEHHKSQTAYRSNLAHEHRQPKSNQDVGTHEHGILKLFHTHNKNMQTHQQSVTSHTSIHEEEQLKTSPNEFVQEHQPLTTAPIEFVQEHQPLTTAHAVRGHSQQHSQTKHSDSLHQHESLLTRHDTNVHGHGQLSTTHNGAIHEHGHLETAVTVSEQKNSHLKTIHDHSEIVQTHRQPETIHGDTPTLKATLDASLPELGHSWTTNSETANKHGQSKITHHVSVHEHQQPTTIRTDGVLEQKQLKKTQHDQQQHLQTDTISEEYGQSQTPNSVIMPKQQQAKSTHDVNVHEYNESNATDRHKSETMHTPLPLQTIDPSYSNVMDRALEATENANDVKQDHVVNDVFPVPSVQDTRLDSIANEYEPDQMLMDSGQEGQATVMGHVSHGKDPSHGPRDKNACMFRGKLYKTGDVWNRGCNFTCVCEDETVGKYRCRHRSCPTVTSLPTHCVLARTEDGCCFIPDCTMSVAAFLGQPDIGVTTGVTSPPVDQEQVGSQRLLPQHHSGEQTHRENINHTSTQHPTGSSFNKDKERNPSTNTDTNGNAILESGSQSKEKTDQPILTMEDDLFKLVRMVTGSCVYKGRRFLPGETWADGCDVTCRCLNGLTGNYGCKNRCRQFDVIPEQCTLHYPPGDTCCKILHCPTKESHGVTRHHGSTQHHEVTQNHSSAQHHEVTQHHSSTQQHGVTQSHDVAQHHGSTQHHGVTQNHDATQHHSSTQHHGVTQNHDATQHHSFTQHGVTQNHDLMQHHGVTQNHNVKQDHISTQHHAMTQKHNVKQHHSSTQHHRHAVTQNHNIMQHHSSRQHHGVTQNHDATQHHSSTQHHEVMQNHEVTQDQVQHRIHNIQNVDKTVHNIQTELFTDDNFKNAVRVLNLPPPPPFPGR